MTSLDLKGTPHRRFNPLTGAWVLVSPHRTQRPWQGQLEQVQKEIPPSYDLHCYMCPGNKRAAGAHNPDYRSTFVFDNDYSALLPDTPTAEMNLNGLLLAKGEAGICRVLCFSPRHDLTISGMEVTDLRRVVDAWAQQWQELGERPFINYVQIFENRGAMMGASNPHPHGQIWASSSIPDEPAKEQAAQQRHLESHGCCLLCQYLSIEEKSGERLVCGNEHFAAVVPFWAVWPFETIVIPRRHAACLPELSAQERDSLADILKKLTAKYDLVFETPFPYSMGFHQRPTDSEPHTEWHMHAHFYPPLLRSATVRKFMVGYEMLATPQRDVTPESAAELLRANSMHESVSKKGEA
jgi:UDPglucose--hexose-1-phosphate uridylyltransferase